MGNDLTEGWNLEKDAGDLLFMSPAGEAFRVTQGGSMLIATGSAAKATNSGDPLLVLNAISAPPSAGVPGQGGIYVAADGTLHYRGPNTDTQIAVA